VRTIRVGNGCGFWGDNLDAPVRLVESGQLDYLTLEYLAELTLSIMAHQRRRDPEKGYATDFIDVLRRIAPHMREQPRLRIITNAGGMNVAGCATAARRVLDQAGLTDARVALVTGDDLTGRLNQLIREGHALTHMDTGEPLEPLLDRVVSANAYLGAEPIVQGLADGARVVITGRVADASLTVAPAIHEFGWPLDDWTRIAGATVAGHLIECGAQVTGGLFCDWTKVPDFAHIGYPIAAIAEDGTFEITKPAGSGGLVDRDTVIEQLLYEIGDPADYLTPDVRANFTTLTVTDTAAGARITGATGQPRTDSLKVTITYRDGYMASGILAVYGRDEIGESFNKAQQCGMIVLERVADAVGQLARSHFELIGYSEDSAAKTTGLRLAVHDPDRTKVERFCRELTPLVTAGPPGVAGYADARPHPREVLAYWPALVPRAAVLPEVGIV
jgi:Acyclic terpene utilisation family protein AtuA